MSKGRYSIYRCFNILIFMYLSLYLSTSNMSPPSLRKTFADLFLTQYRPCWFCCVLKEVHVGLEPKWPLGERPCNLLFS